jgi:ATP-dependent DNA helicase RecG
LQIAAAKSFMSSQIRNFTRLGRDGRFVTNPEYPEDVWLEAVINAVVHRSYNLKNMNIFLKMFEDKFVVESPGAFLPPTTARDCV